MRAALVALALVAPALGLRRSLPARRVVPPAVRARVAMRVNPEAFEGSAMTITEYPMPVLRNPNANVTRFDDAFKQTCAEMMKIMYQADGVGLAATQVGIPERFFVYNPSGNADLGILERIVVNPRIFEYGRETVVEEEGCLSTRSEDCAGEVARAREIWAEYQTVDGAVKRLKLRDFEARVFQHEYDHIEGVLHVDRLDAADRAKAQPTLDAMVEAHGPGGVADLDPAKASALVPPVPRAGRMPPAAGGTPRKLKAPKAPAGFGAKTAPPKKRKK